MERVEDLYLAPVTLRQANDFISKHHKNNQPVPRDKFSIGCAVDGRLMGVIVVGYPRDPAMNDGQTLLLRQLIYWKPQASKC